MNQELNKDADLRDISRQLESALDTQLIADVLLYRQERLKNMASALEKIAAGLSDQKPVKDTGKTGIEPLKSILEPKEVWVTRLVQDVHKVAAHMPKNIILKESEERFTTAEEDPWFIKSAKAGKRITRKAGKTHWKQNVPLRNVIALHLFDATELFTRWIDEDEQLLLQIMVELEQGLARRVLHSSEEGSSSGMQQLYKVLQHQIHERLNGLEQELVEARNDLKADLLAIISQVNTVERRAGLYNDKRVQKKEGIAGKHLRAYTEQWQKVLKKLFDKTENLQQFLVFSSNLNLEVQSLSDDIERYFSEGFINPLGALQNKLEHAREKIRHHQKGSSEIIIAQQKQLLGFIDEELILPIEGMMEQENLRKLIENFTRQVISAAGHVHEHASFILKFDKDKKPPELTTRVIEWRLIVVRSIKEHILSHFKPDEAAVKETLKEQFSEIKSIREVVDINLESAAELSEDTASKENSGEIAEEALERTEAKLKKCIDALLSLQRQLYEPVVAGQKQFNSTMLNLLHHSDGKTLSKLDAKYKVSEKTHSWMTRFRAGWARTQDRAAVLIRFISQKGKHYYTTWATTLGLKKREVKEAHKADIVAYLSETEKRLQELPYIYRELFSIKADPDRRNYVGVNENFGHIRQAFERWGEGQRVACAVVGEKGSGKSTYINLTKKELFAKEELWHLDLTQTCVTEKALISLFQGWTGKEDITDMDELAAFLQQRKKRSVILIEGMQNLYLRHLNGYEAIEKLLYLISETNNQIFWVVSCSKYAWGFLEKAADISNYFPYMIRTDTLNEQQIERIILNRHRNSGYELVFETGEGYKKNRAYRKLMDKEEKAQEHLREKYFKELTKLSKGNASIAMIFWVRSVRAFDDTHFFIALLESASLEIVEDLNTTILFVFAALVLHDVLNVEELALVLGLHQKESRLIFNRLQAKGIVVAKDGGMALNHLIYRQVIEELKERNILHVG